MNINSRTIFFLHATLAQGLLHQNPGKLGWTDSLNPFKFYVEQGVPKTQVLLRVYGEQLLAVLDNVVLAEYRCRYGWRERKVRDIHDGVFYPTRFAASQGTLISLHPQSLSEKVTLSLRDASPSGRSWRP